MAIKKRNDEEFISDLIAPISDIYQESNSKVLSIMVNRIKQIGTLSPTDAGRLSIMLKNRDLAEIEKVLSDATKLSISQIDSIVEESASYNDDLSEELFKARNISANSFRSNSSLLAIVEQAKKSMVDDVVRLSNTTAFVLNGKVTDIGKTYNYAVNRAVFETQQGLFDFNTSLRSVVKDLIDSGVRVVEYDTILQNGKPLTRRLDSAARLNVAEGIRQTNNLYREKQGEIFGADMVFISAHSLCATDHQKINGQDYTLKEWERTEENLERKISTNNCKHSKTYGIKGISKNPYTDADRSEMIENSNKEVKYSTLLKNKDGNYVKKTIPKYEGTQVLRKVETDIRRLKDAKYQYEVMGDSGMVSEYNKRITSKSRYYKQIASEMGLETKPDRVRIVK